MSLSDILIPMNNKELIFTQRQLLTRIHHPAFMKHNPWKRNIDLYDVRSQKPETISEDQLQNNVSFYTKFPKQVKTIFGNIQIYTHLVVEEYATDAEVIGYGLQGLLKGSLNPKDIEDRLSYEEDYITNGLSQKILEMTEMPCGICLYTNYHSKDPNLFDLFIDLPNCEFTHQLPLVCIYQDITLSDKYTLKNIIFKKGRELPSPIKEMNEDEQRRFTTIELVSSSRIFKKVWEKSGVELKE